MGFGLLAVPVIAVILFFIIQNRKLIYGISVLASVLMLVLSGVMTLQVAKAGSVSYAALGGLMYVDSLSIIVLDIITILGFMINVYSAGYLEGDIKSKKIDAKRVKLYYILLMTFEFTMVLSVTVKNMGIMWVAIEATTLASVFLVGFYNKRESMEAAWKYIIICSVGIAMAFLGIVFLHLSSIGVLTGEGEYLNFTALTENAAALKTPILKLAFIFILAGFGTKAGFAPMHTWLPAAHSQAPSPVSAMLSGVLLNSAMYGIIRALTIVNINLGSSSYTRNLMMAFGFLSIGIAAIVIITQKEYKSLLAYSSIEHMGIIALAVGFFTPASIFAALLHMINHSFTKSMLFLATGNILQKYHTVRISKIQGVLKTLPVSGTIFLLGLLAIAGTPPFGIFASEFNVLASIFEAHSFVAAGVAGILFAVIFAGIVHCIFGMFYGEPQEQMPKGETNKAGVAVLAVLFVVILISGLWLPQELVQLLEGARDVIMGV